MVQLVECPRDAMQGWPYHIETEKKVTYLNALLQAGFHTLDFGSFVSHKLIPQMADTAEVVARLEPGNSATRLLAIIANQRGASDASAYDIIHYLGFPFSVSPAFQLRNANSTIGEAYARLDAIQQICVQNKKELVVYISMGFGNPYGDPYSEELVLHWVEKIAALGVNTISLADTVGLATAEQVYDTTRNVIQAFPQLNIGVHLHASPQNSQQKIDAAVRAGCQRFDGAIRGIGGCPMANDELVGNIDSLQLITYFDAHNIPTGINPAQLRRCTEISDSIFVKHG